MLGLIKKDLLVIKSNAKTLFLVFFIFAFASLNQETNFVYMIPILCITVFISTFSYDDYNNWNAYAIGLPCGRKDIVKSKYIATVILMIVSSILSVLVILLVNLLKNEENYENIFSSFIGCLFSVSLLSSVMYPLIFKYGSEKGRIALFIGVFVIAIIIGVLSKLVDETNIQNTVTFLDNWAYILIPAVSILLYFVSYFISKKIYSKKEF